MHHNIQPRGGLKQLVRPSSARSDVGLTCSLHLPLLHRNAAYNSLHRRESTSCSTSMPCLAYLVPTRPSQVRFETFIFSRLSFVCLFLVLCWIPFIRPHICYQRLLFVASPVQSNDLPSLYPFSYLLSSLIDGQYAHRTLHLRCQILCMSRTLSQVA